MQKYHNVILIIFLISYDQFIQLSNASIFRHESSIRLSFASWNELLARRGGAIDGNLVEVVQTDQKNRTDCIESTVSSAGVNSWRADMPEKLRRKGPKTFQKLRLGMCDIYLLGTAHVSNDSSIDVKLLLEHVNPDAIFVELCESRIPLLEGFHDSDKMNAFEKTKKMRFMDHIKTIRQAQGGSFIQALSTFMLTSVQQDYAIELDVELGGEFRCAYSFWKNRTKDIAKRPFFVLGDRPMYLTLIRAWESLTWWPKIKVFSGLVYSCLRKPNKDEIQKWLETVMEYESDVLTKSFEEMRKHFPTLYTTIIEERDDWLAAKLVQTSRELVFSEFYNSVHFNSSTRVSIVAVVGAGHVPGISRRLTTKTTNETPEDILLKLVQTRRWAKDDFVNKQVIPRWIRDVSHLDVTMG